MTDGKRQNKDTPKITEKRHTWKPDQDWKDFIYQAQDTQETDGTLLMYKLRQTANGQWTRDQTQIQNINPVILQNMRDLGSIAEIELDSDYRLTDKSIDNILSHYPGNATKK